MAKLNSRSMSERDPFSKNNKSMDKLMLSPQLIHKLKSISLNIKSMASLSMSKITLSHSIILSMKIKQQMISIKLH